MLFLHSCPRCGGAMSDNEDGRGCITCGARTYQHQSAEPKVYFTGRCQGCLDLGYIFFNLVDGRKRWLCWRCSGKLERQAS
jgi:hypothetical protein